MSSYLMNDSDLDKLESIITKKDHHKKDYVYESGQPLKALFAIRSGSVKTSIITETGEEKITGFHLPGEVFGFDGLAEETYTNEAIALETAMICQVPFDNLELISAQIPQLRRQIFRLMSKEINDEQVLNHVLSQKTAEEKLATFLYSLSKRYEKQGLSGHEFALPMKRADIANYLGLTNETLSRLFANLKKAGHCIESKLLHDFRSGQIKRIGKQQTLLTLYIRCALLCDIS